MSRQVVLLLFAFVAGGAIGYAVRASLVETPVAPGPGGSAGRVEAPPPEPEPAASLPAPVARTLDEAVEALRPPDLPRVAGTIAGAVKTEAGEPVAGVRVIAEARGPNRDVPKDAPIAEQVRAFTESRLYVQASRAEAESGPDGAFVLSGLIDAPYWVRGEHEAWSVRGRNDVRPGDRADLVATPAVTLDITVLLPDGTEPKSANVLFTTDEAAGSPRQNRWSPASRKIQVVPGAWRVWAVAGDLAEMVSEKQDLPLSAGQRALPLTLRVGERPGIRGTLTVPEGEGFDGLRVAAVKFAGAARPESSRLLRESRQVYAYQERKWAFALVDLPPGTYLVGAIEQSAVLAETVVEVADRMVEVTLTVSPLERSTYAVVWVEGPDGKPVVEQVYVTSTYRSERGSIGGWQSVRRPDGSYRVGLPAELPDDDSAGKWLLHVQSPKFGARQVEFARSEATVVRVRFEEPVFLEVVVENYAGSESEGSVMVNVQSKDGMSQAQVNLDAEGRGKSGPLAPGPGTVTLSIQSPQGQYVNVLKQDVDILPGAKVSLRLPLLYDLTVLVKDGTAHVNAGLMPVDREAGPFATWSRSDRTGRVVFTRVPAGRYRLQVSGLGEGDGSMEVTVPGASVIRFEPATLSALRVRITDPKGLLARSGFAEGDLVVAIDGQELTGERQMQALLQLAATKPQVAFEVLRGAARLAIDFPGTEYGRGRRDSGGWFEPAAR